MVLVAINRQSKDFSEMRLFATIDDLCEFVYPSSKSERRDFKAEFEKTRRLRSIIGGDLIESAEINPIVEQSLLAEIEEFDKKE